MDIARLFTAAVQSLYGTNLILALKLTLTLFPNSNHKIIKLVTEADFQTLTKMACKAK